MTALTVQKDINALIHKHSFGVCASLIYVGESPVDLSVSAQRPVCVGSKHCGIMGDEVRCQGQEHTTVCIVHECLCVLDE